MKYLCLVYLSKEKWSACPDAIRLATKIPPVQHGSIEVRPVRELDVTGFQSFTPPASELAT